MQQFFTLLGGLKRLRKIHLSIEQTYPSLLDDLTESVLKNTAHLECLKLVDGLGKYHRNEIVPCTEQKFINFLSSDSNLPHLKVLTLEMPLLTSKQTTYMLQSRKRRSLSGHLTTRREQDQSYFRMFKSRQDAVEPLRIHTIDISD